MLTTILRFVAVSIMSLLLFAQTSFAAECRVDNAKVINVYQWSDGNIFIALDKNSNCNCGLQNRFGFHKDANQKFFTAAALTALAAGKTVSVFGEDAGCPVQGNTAALTILFLNAN